MNPFKSRTATPVAPVAPLPVLNGGTPAISLTKMQGSAPGLVDLYKQAGVSLEKQGLSGRRAAVYLVVDRSGSMRPFYRNGTVQRLAEQALGLSAQLDDDGQVPLIFFDGGVFPEVVVDLRSYQGAVAREHARLGNMGGTAYAPAMRAVIDHYKASGAIDPAFVIFQTDGEPFDRRDAETTLKLASDLRIFWQFVGFGRSFDFLERLDDLRGRTVDNAGFFAVDPAGMRDTDLYDKLMAEYPAWLAAAQAARILP